MARKFTRRSNVTNNGGFVCPPKFDISWRIVFLKDGQLAYEERTLDSSTCPRKWLQDEHGVDLEVDGLAEMIC